MTILACSASGPFLYLDIDASRIMPWTGRKPCFQISGYAPVYNAVYRFDVVGLTFKF